MKSKKKKILLILSFIFLLYLIWISFNLLTFKTYKSTEVKEYPHEVEGVYHLHSTHSDGRKGVDEIARLASQASLDFIIFTDHGSPNRESYASQEWKEGVLVLAGTEISVSRGHLVALGFNLPSRKFSLETEHAVYEIEGVGGFSIIAHPYSKTRWSWGEFVGYSGIEIMNADSMLRKDIFVSLPSLPALLLKPKYFLLKILDNPERNLRKWDELNSLHPIYGYFSVDAHILYRTLFDSFHLHLLLQRPLSADFDQASQQVFDALKKGRFYNSIHAAAHGQGFRFWGEKGAKTLNMGSEAILDSPVTIHMQAPFPFSKEIHLIHNGKSIYISTQDIASYNAEQPGTYRVEVYLRESSPLDRNVPWIISNPIFLREANNDRN